jgi:hypothetical protein
MAIGSPQWMYASGEAYEIDQSLRFDEDRGTYLSWTPAAAGNRKTFTVSAWVKTSLKSTEGVKLLRAYGGDDDNWTAIGSLDSSGDLWATYNRVGNSNSGRVQVTGKFRDPSSWYHIVIAVDTTQGTAANRVKTYINGEQTSHSYTDYPSQNFDYSFLNNTYEHRIFYKVEVSSNEAGDGYLAEMNFIDGQQLTPADFGETGDYGEWKPKEYSGTYGTNGFYLPFKQDYTVEGFSTVTYRGNGVNTGDTNYIGGVGFQPDLVWAKRRNSTGNHALVDSVRGVTSSLRSNSTIAESIYSTNANITSLDTDGFTIGATSGGNALNGTGYACVAWNWDMGGSNASNSNGSITSTVRANPTYGQSIVSYTGTGSVATIGHGLSAKPELIITKARSDSQQWGVQHEALGATKYLLLDTNGAAGTASSLWNDTEPTSSVFTVGTTSTTNGSSTDYIAYCFHSVTGYSKFGSYSGSGNASGNSVALGFEPAFVMVKASSGSYSWAMFDNTRAPDSALFANVNNVEESLDYMDFTSTGFNLTTTHPNANGSGQTYIYMAFADKREYAYWLDQSGNNNDFTSNNLTESDISVDSPTNNFATLNPLIPDAYTTLSEGNLKIVHGSSFGGQFASQIAESGKWYAEYLVTTVGLTKIGIASANRNLSAGDPQNWAEAFWYNQDGTQRDGSTDSSYGASYTNGDIIGIKLDQDNNTIDYSKNGVYQGSISLSGKGIGTNPTFIGTAGRDSTGVWNFGQDSSFAGNKTAQGNQDGNEIGDFYYTPPTGFLALCTKNLPDVAVVPSEHFNTVLWTGDDTDNRSITGVGFQPDFHWNKARNRNGGDGYYLYDAIRGATKVLYSNATNAEATEGNALQAFESDGFQIGSDGNSNSSSYNYVAWNWKANGSGSSNTNGSITSTVSANVDAGFSIVSYTGTGSAGTVGHGLSKVPEMIIVKGRTANADNWRTYHSGLTDPTEDYLKLNSNDAQIDGSFTTWNSTAPTSSVFSIHTDNSVNANTKTYIAYAFHSVDGYSKVGSYSTNASTDGAFVYTGFKPALILAKSSSVSGTNWMLIDNARDTINPANKWLKANSSDAEFSPTNKGTGWDFTSNGFKIRNHNDDFNSPSGNTWIYIAFAETPFKYSNAR